jgi:cadmium resistance protein CadD (predicted permease)
MPPLQHPPHHQPELRPKAMVWLGIANWLTSRRTIGAPIRRYGHRLVPFVLIALGLLILYEARTFELLRR